MTRSVLLVTPLRVEALCARRGAPAAVVLRTGMGRDRSVAAAGRVAAGARASGAPVVVLGLGGGLRDGQRAGDVVVAESLAVAAALAAGGEDSSPALVPLALAGSVAPALRDAGLPVSVGTVVSTARLQHGRAARAALAAGDGAPLAVDMESWWLAGEGRLLPAPLAVVRVLSDAPGQELLSWRAPAAIARAFRVLVQAARALAAWCAALIPSPTEVPS